MLHPSFRRHLNVNSYSQTLLSEQVLGEFIVYLDWSVALFFLTYYMSFLVSNFQSTHKFAIFFVKKVGFYKKVLTLIFICQKNELSFVKDLCSHFIFTSNRRQQLRENHVFSCWNIFMKTVFSFLTIFSISLVGIFPKGTSRPTTHQLHHTYILKPTQLLFHPPHQNFLRRQHGFQVSTRPISSSIIVIRMLV